MVGWCVCVTGWVLEGDFGGKGEAATAFARASFVRHDPLEPYTLGVRSKRRSPVMKALRSHHPLILRRSMPDSATTMPHVLASAQTRPPTT